MSEHVTKYVYKHKDTHVTSTEITDILQSLFKSIKGFQFVLSVYAVTVFNIWHSNVKVFEWWWHICSYLNQFKLYKSVKSENYITSIHVSVCFCTLCDSISYCYMEYTHIDIFTQPLITFWWMYLLYFHKRKTEPCSQLLAFSLQQSDMF